MAVPPATPFTMPDDGAIVATDGLPLDQMPPGEASVSVEVDPAQNDKTPVGVDGRLFTVTDFVAAQPLLRAYEIVTVPAIAPVITLPEPPKVTLPLLQLHEPPVVGSLNVDDEPIHTVEGPVMGNGVGITVAIVLAVQPAEVV